MTEKETVEVPEYVKEIAKDDPAYAEWYTKKEQYIEEHNTEHPQEDTYVVTVEMEITFARENDGVLNEEDAKMWLKGGDILQSNDGDYKILKVRKKGASE